MTSNVYCTNCRREFVATLDLGLSGNHEITCPHCRHVHYRVVRDGEVTEDRWRSSAGPTYIATVSTTINVAATNYFATNAGTTTFATTAWLNRSDLNFVI